VSEQSVDCLAAALERFHTQALWRQLPAEGQRSWAETFSPERFHGRMTEELQRLWEGHQQRQNKHRNPLPLPVPLA
jgi:hypothetical protein